MQAIRIVAIPKMKAVYLGPLSSREKFENFIAWFSKYHASLQCELFPRDFMRYNKRLNTREWYYVLPSNCNLSEITEYEIVDLPSGLYAVASCLNADLDAAKDWLSNRKEIIKCVDENDHFALYLNGEGKEERYPMFHIISPGWMMPLGISMEDLYVPIIKRDCMN